MEQGGQPGGIGREVLLPVKIRVKERVGPAPLLRPVGKVVQEQQRGPGQGRAGIGLPVIVLVKEGKINGIITVTAKVNTIGNKNTIFTILVCFLCGNG